MKRILAMVLCLVMLCSVMVTANAAEPFTSFGTTATPLFLINGENKAGQEFVPDQAGIKGIKVYLSNESANNPIEVTVYSGTPETGTKVYSETLSLERVAADWFALSFSKEVAVTAGDLYSFVIHTTNRAVWNGATVDGDYKAWNYDVGAYGGWVRGNIAAFELIGAEETVPAYEQITKDIAALPPLEEITMEHKDTVMGIYNEYEKLSIADRNLVQGFENLVYAKQKIEDMIYREEHKARFEIEDAITALGTITPASREALVSIDQMVYAYAYENGTEIVGDIENYQTYLDAVKTYNALNPTAETPLYGDADENNEISASDALAVLRQVVGKIKMTDQQFLLADVDGNGTISAEDALFILKYIVGKLTKFPVDVEVPADPIEPVTHTLPLYSKKSESLFEKTYASMIDRTQSNGYAQTSLNGAYVGMFGRDSSIQIMSHIAEGDYDHAAKIMKYIIDYHNTQKKDYVLHIMLDNAPPYSDKVQTDSTFFFLHAWYLYATKAPESETKTAFLAATEGKVKKFADYFMDEFYFNTSLGLVENPHLEHSKEGREWYTFDLLTNVYASQAWHEMSLYFAKKDPAKAKAWADAADAVVKGVHTHLVSEIDGKRYYAELIDLDKVTDVTAEGIAKGLEKGFSWVNMSPVGCDWYALDDALMENTYQLYQKYGSVRYYGKYKMLEVHTRYTGSTNIRGNHVIGKGLAWEMMYCKKMGYTDRLRTLAAFVENYSEDMYRETWVYAGGGSDTANQEHASWMLFAQKTCFPQLAAGEKQTVVVNGLRVGTYNIHILSDANAATIANDIKSANLDIVGIQEVDKNTNRTGKVDQAKLLADELGWYYGYSKAIDLEGGAYGNAILSKYPIQSYETIQLPSGTEEQRVCGRAVIKAGDRTVNFFNTHLTWTDLQSGQFQEIADHLDGLDNFIITGDFNCSNFDSFNVLGGNLVNNATDTFETCGDGAIDNIVVSKNLKVGKGTMVENNHSDHHMLYADVTF